MASRPIWYRSLYWRIALGFVALLAVLLAAQGTVFFWLTGRVGAAWFGRSAAQLATAIATDLSRELGEHSDTDIDDYINTRYQGAFRSFAVVMSDGHAGFSKRVVPPSSIDFAARMRLFQEGIQVAGRRPDFFPGRGPGDGGGGGRRGFGGRFDGGPGPGPGPGPGLDYRRRGDRYRGGPGGPGPGGTEFEFALITIGGQTAGVVAVPFAPPPLSIAMLGLGPTLVTVGVGLLVAGTAIGALLVFRPTHKRLQALQVAAQAVGSGQIGVRAPESGGDEVTALARAFNDMAGQLEQRTQALEAVDRSRRQLVADVSHELTTPLAAIRGYVETLSMSNLPLDDAARSRYLRIVGEETDRLEHIVGDLLDVARLEGGAVTLSMEDVPVAQLLERLRHRHGQVLEQKGLTLETSLAPEDLTVPADAKRLEQVLQNLVANAARHTPSGGRITVSARRNDGFVHMSVEDTGPGIPPEHLARVFDRFYKTDVSRTGTDQPSGSGLGLSIVRAIVERHGGRIAVANVPGAGARFDIFLPAGE